MLEMCLIEQTLDFEVWREHFDLKYNCSPWTFAGSLCFPDGISEETVFYI